MVGNDHPREQLVRHLSESSELLHSQLQDFRNIAPHLEIVSFYETHQSRSLILVRLKLYTSWRALRQGS